MGVEIEDWECMNVTSSVHTGRWQASLKGGAQERKCGGAAVAVSGWRAAVV